jgi:hypothetical protein
VGTEQEVVCACIVTVCLCGVHKVGSWGEIVRQVDKTTPILMEGESGFAAVSSEAGGHVGEAGEGKVLV